MTNMLDYYSTELIKFIKCFYDTDGYITKANGQYLPHFHPATLPLCHPATILLFG